MATQRPLGVTILSILEIISGLFELGVGGLLLIAAGFVGGMMPEGVSGFGGILAGILTAIGIVFIILGLFAFLITYGLWTGKGWAWALSLIFSIIGIILSILSLPTGIIGLIIEILILYYLTRPHVKAFFGRGPPPEAPPPPPP
jgi:hypothetical protein